MKLLLFGGSGQLGLEIRARARDLNLEVLSPVSSEVDITDADTVSRLVREVSPDVVVNSAAYTAVDKAEEEPEKAYAINCDGAKNAVLAAKQIGARYIYISTDYVFSGNVFSGNVFSGSSGSPLREDTPANPLNVYGASKRAGEEQILTLYSERSIILRTSSLFGRFGENFVKTILKLLEERGQVNVVTDQTMSPTWAGWLADVVLDLARISDADLRAISVLHATCSGSVSWYDFARAALDIARPTIVNGERCEVHPTTADAFKRPAARPQHSVLDCSLLESVLKRKALPWRDGLYEYLREINRVNGGVDQP